MTLSANQDKKKSHPSAYMYYSMWNANLQKKEFENKLLKRYKYCIKIRPDILLHENIKLLDLNFLNCVLYAKNNAKQITTYAVVTQHLA